MPDGFTRPATPDEADLIIGRITEAVYLQRTGQSDAPSAVLAKTTKPTATKRKPSPVMRKLLGWNRFLDRLMHHEHRLHPLAVAVWCWLWRCERKGFARASERKLANRFGVDRKTVRARLDELNAAGFLSVARRGVHGRRATVYRVRTMPKPTSTTEPT
jgi:hypothetical protein